MLAAWGDQKARRVTISRSTPRPSLKLIRSHTSLDMVRKKSGPGRLALKGTFQIGEPNPLGLGRPDVEFDVVVTIERRDR
jgi:hypothetical protein